MKILDVFGFEMKKLVLPAVLVAVFFFVMLFKSPYAARFIETAGYYTSTTLDFMNGLYMGFLTFLKPANVMTVTPIDDTLFVITLIISGYLLSSAILFLHRHNRAIYSRGNQMFLMVFLFSVLAFLVVNEKYLLLDPRITLAVSFVIGYLATSFIWGVYDLIKMYEVMKRLKKQKKLAKYFRWEFRYLK